MHVFATFFRNIFKRRRGVPRDETRARHSAQRISISIDKRIHSSTKCKTTCFPRGKHAFFNHAILAESLCTASRTFLFARRGAIRASDSRFIATTPSERKIKNLRSDRDPTGHHGGDGTSSAARRFRRWATAIPRSMIDRAHPNQRAETARRALRCWERTRQTIAAGESRRDRMRLAPFVDRA